MIFLKSYFRVETRGSFWLKIKEQKIQWNLKVKTTFGKNTMYSNVIKLHSFSPCFCVTTNVFVVFFLYRNCLNNVESKECLKNIKESLQTNLSLSSIQISSILYRTYWVLWKIHFEVITLKKSIIWMISKMRCELKLKSSSFMLRKVEDFYFFFPSQIFDN